MGEDDISEQQILAAIRKRLLDEASGGRRSDSERIVNNVYGSMPGGGLNERLYQGDIASGADEDPYQYFVDIDREDTRNEAGEKTGWKKRVRRYRDQLPREDVGMPKKKSPLNEELDNDMSGGHGQDPGGEVTSSPRSFSPMSDFTPPAPDDDPPQAMSREEWLRATQEDIDPAKYAGEGWGATEEYFPQDIDNPYTRGDVTGEGEYYPGPDPKKRKWPPYRSGE